VAEVSFFISGALFCFVLVAAILVLLGKVAPPPAVIIAPDGGRGHAARPVARRVKPRAATQGSLSPTRPVALVQGPGQTRQPDHADAYRIAGSLDLAERALTRIACGPEADAAKIARQTLRRLSVATEPPKARLDFARHRLELLSLRSDPTIGRAASAALGAMV
jgi:hypothetical protein